MKIAGSRSGSISQRHGSADTDPYQNVMDPQHCKILRNNLKLGIKLEKIFVIQVSVIVYKFIHKPTLKGMSILSMMKNRGNMFFIY
jgi:hypothetical protein